MDSLGGIGVFVLVAEQRSFTAAARLLGVSASAVGKTIARMETRLAVRLFHRSTRSITLTAEGALFLQRCRSILGEVEAAEAELSDAAAAPRGRLRIGAPQLTGLLMPALDGFMQAWPDVELDIDLSNSMVDVIEDGFDVVIRTGEPHDSRLSARRLGAARQVLVATPAYCAAHGIPQRPADLLRHSCIMNRYQATGKLEVWPLRQAGAGADEAAPLMLPASIVTNTIEAITYLTLQGRGIAFLPTFMVREELASGALVTVLDDYLHQSVTFWMLWPASRYPSPKLRVFIDYMAAHLQI
jgi:DNA-binding transcriptional LysR family regulator